MRDIRSTIDRDTCRLCGSPADHWCTAELKLRRDAAAARIGGRTRERRYLRCPVCGQIQCHAADLPEAWEERERYEEHNNTLDDPRYADYLNSFIDSAILPFVPPGTQILDFGSGPEPALTRLLEYRGYRSIAYDPFFAADPQALGVSESSAVYDGIVAVEVVEHLHRPAFELQRLRSRLARHGVLAVRTGIFTGDEESFRSWWYRRDISHVSFWTEATIAWLEATLALQVVHRAPGDVVVFRAVDTAGLAHTCDWQP